MTTNTLTPRNNGSSDFKNESLGVQADNDNTPDRPYSPAFLASLPQSPDNYNAEDLAELWVEWNDDQPKAEPELSTGEQADIVDEAFSRVCMAFACKLQTLLAETRKRGLTDGQVKAVLQSSESDIEADRFSAWQTGTGELFLQSDNGVSHVVASVNELFAEIETSEPSYSLSEDIRSRGHELTKLEAIVLDVAQTLCAKFKKGSAVSPEQVKRVVTRYNPGTQCVTVRAAMAALVKRGLCSNERGEFRLVEHFGTQKREVSNFARITQTDDQERLLLVCNACVSFFRSQNVVTRRAVKVLMRERHNLGANQTRRFIRQLIAADVLETVTTHGESGIRLTDRAADIVNPNRLTAKNRNDFGISSVFESSQVVVSMT